MEHQIKTHKDSLANRWWWIVLGRLNGLDTTYSDPKYKTENKAKRAAFRYIQRWSK